MPKLLLHICCGSCATSVIEQLADDYEISGYFYNPNIYPEDEYMRRLEATRTVARRLDIPIIEGAYETGAFLDAVQGLEQEPENGARCEVCYRLRFADTAHTAVNGSYEIIASTLTVGPMKKASVINPIGEEEAGLAGVKFLAEDWKKKDGFRRSCELSREFGIYRQHYCGCVYSMRQDEHR